MVSGMLPFDPALHRALTGILTAAGIEDAALEAKWICEDFPDADRALEIAHRRANREPLQYLLGKWEFYGLELRVQPGVLIPRADTETLVDAVLQRVENRADTSVVDLCTGSGCIALALKAHLSLASVTGIELDPTAYAIAAENEKRLGLGVQLLRGDVLDPAVAAQFGGLSAVVCNPPYLTDDEMAHLQPEVRHEPAMALSGGADGLRFYREITRLWKHALAPGGLLAFEIGWTQAESVKAILAENGFSGIEATRDPGGNFRAVTGRKEPTA